MHVQINEEQPLAAIEEVLKAADVAKIDPSYPNEKQVLLVIYSDAFYCTYRHDVRLFDEELTTLPQLLNILKDA